jgi:hypothetical protein
MPLLQKAPAPPPERNAPASAPTDPAALLAQLLGAASQQGFAAETRASARSRRQREASYDRLVRLLAVGIGLALCGAAWLAGSYFSLVWLASLGFGLANVGLAPIELLLAIGRTPPRFSWVDLQSMWGTVALAWSIPLSITLAEVGFDPGRANGRASRSLWMLVLGLDAGTTALGIQPILSTAISDVLLAWTLAVCIGILLAVAPEKLARRLVLENVHSSGAVS